MKKIRLPNDDMEVSFNACTGSIIDEQERARHDECLAELLIDESDYIERARLGTLFEILPTDSSVLDSPIILKGLDKDSLIYLYNYYMVKRDPGRRVYDRIMAAAGENCPFCGGIGTPKQLDHFLPKAHFPRYSVMPSNLIPACLDCNIGGKKSKYAKTIDDQILHPYLDDEKFFTEQWIFARVLRCDPCVIEFYTDPPSGWSDTDRKRVMKHFKECDLAARYSKQAGTQLSAVMSQRACNDPESFKKTVLIPVVNSGEFANHWMRVMYQALAADSWFCSG